MERPGGRAARIRRRATDRRAVGFLVATLILATAAPLARAAAEPFALVDPQRVSPAGGKISFCSPDSSCVEFRIDDLRGRFDVPEDTLAAGVAYDVIYQPADGGEPHALMGWRHDPHAAGPVADPQPGFPGEVRVATFVVAAGGGLTFRLDRGVPRDWTRPPTRSPTPAPGAADVFDRMPVLPPAWEISLGSPLVLGGQAFTGSGEPPLDVASVAPGITLAVAHHWFATRTAGADPAGWWRHLTVSGAYAANRYETGLADQSGQQSDVTFHRGEIGCGVGWLRGGRLDLGVQALLAFGGVFDGSRVLEYDGDDYTRVGFGGVLTAVLLLRAGGLDVGPRLTLGHVRYGGGPGPGDDWSGGMTTLTVGVTVR